MNSGKHRIRLMELDGPLLVAQIAVDRLIQSVQEYVSLVNTLPGLETTQHDVWGELERQAEARIELDVHSTVCTSHLLFKLIQEVPGLKTDLTPATVENIDLLRSHYEHWDQMRHHYRRPNMAIPVGRSKGSKKVARYSELYGSGPRGGLKVKYDGNTRGRSVSWVRIGGSLEPYVLRQQLQSLRSAHSKLLSSMPTDNEKENL